MGLYLTVFKGDDELDGVEIGSYADFGEFRHTIKDRLENGRMGARFPILNLHSDCDGEWSPSECAGLEKELVLIQAELQRLPAIPITGQWQQEVARSLGIRPTRLDQCFFDPDGEPLLERLIGLARLAQQERVPILFQ